jgi:hypothetical protein
MTDLVKDAKKASQNIEAKFKIRDGFPGANIVMYLGLCTIWLLNTWSSLSTFLS